MNNYVVLVTLCILSLTVQGCAAGRAVSDRALKAVGVSPATALETELDARAQEDHWSEEWVWKGDTH